MEKRRSSFQWRALISVVVSLGFLLLLVTGSILFIAPPGRVANWTNWKISALTKHDWINLHVTFAAIFLVAGIIHLIFNWRPLLTYLKNRTTRRLGLRAEWVIGLVITLVAVWGTVASLPPFATLASVGESLSAQWDNPQERAPIPHAELLTVAELATEAEVDFELAVKRLNSAGITEFNETTVVKELAAQQDVAAQEIYGIIAPPETTARGGNSQGRGSGGGRGAGRGMGWKTLEQFCTEEGIALADAIQRLDASGFTGKADATLRDIAQANGLEHPFEMLEIIRAE